MYLKFLKAAVSSINQCEKKEEDWDIDDKDYHPSYTNENNVYHCDYIFNSSEKKEKRITILHGHFLIEKYWSSKFAHLRIKYENNFKNRAVFN